ncbi:MAG: hypothetical protein ABI367_08270 [Mucilaginibacter sp.]
MAEYTSHELNKFWQTKIINVVPYLFSRWYYLLGALIFSAFIGYLMYKPLKPTYTANFTFVLSTEQRGNNGLAGLAAQEMGDTLMFRFFLMHKKLLIGICTDILIIYGAFLVATKAMHISTDNQEIILATFICVKISVFYITNLYYRMWRYMEVLEIVGYFIIICIATIILAVILFLKNKAGVYPSYFYLIDFLLTFIGIVFSRLFYRWMSELINRNRFSEKKVIIYGAGDSGYLLIKELLQNHKHQLSPIGWIDDDDTKHNMFLYGYKIFGGIDQLEEICEKNKPDMILISTNAIDKENEEEIRAVLTAQNIGLGRFSLSLSYDIA